MKEIWKEVEGFPGYKVSKSGIIKSFKCYRRSIHILKKRTSQDGYEIVSLRNINGNSKNRFVHRILANAFIKKPFCTDDYRKLQVNHINGIKTDNRLENLEWVTPKEQQYHSRKILKNRCAIGELSGSAKLTKRQVVEIREKLKLNKRGILTSIAKEYNISIGNVHAIKIGRSWNFTI